MTQLENIVLSEKSSKKSFVLLFHLYEVSRMSKFIEIGDRLMIA